MGCQRMVAKLRDGIMGMGFGLGCVEGEYCSDAR